MGCDNNDCDTGIWERTSKAPVPTRLTAEQFLAQQGLADLSLYWPTGKPLPKIDYESKEAAPTLLQLLEAFRDKSEAPKQTHEHETGPVRTDGQYCICTYCGLREQLKSSEEIRSAEKKILLAEVEKNAGLREEIERLKGELLIHGDLKQYRFRGMTFEELTRKLFRLVDAEAEVAALRERERNLIANWEEYYKAFTSPHYAVSNPPDAMAGLRQCIDELKALSAAPERGKDGK